MKETASQREIVYPEGIDNQKVDDLLKRIINGLNRDHFFQDERLSRVQHPLLLKRIGREMAINQEIFDTISEHVLAHSVSGRIANSLDLIDIARYGEKIYLDAASDRDSSESDFAELRALTKQLAELNACDDELVCDFIESRLKIALPLPSDAQGTVLYPPITAESRGESGDYALDLAERVSQDLLKQLEKNEDPKTAKIRQTVQQEIAAIRDYYNQRTS